MNEATFRAQVAQESAQLEADIGLLEAGQHVDGPAFARRYRVHCRRLALARERRYGADMLGAMNALAMRGHAQLYRHNTARWWSRLFELLLGDFPRALRAAALPQLISLGLFLLGGVGAYISVRLDASTIYHFMDFPDALGLEQMYNPASEHFLHPRESGGDVQMFGFYIFNNIGIAFRTFASGLLFGLGSLYFVVYNGVLLGAAAAHIQNAGFGHTFFPFVIGHGAFELTAIVIAGGAGVQLGLALFAPGGYPRVVALQAAARRALPIVYGFGIMLLIAAFLEAFWSSQHALGTTLRYAVGAALWLVVALLLFASGRRRGA